MKRAFTAATSCALKSLYTVRIAILVNFGGSAMRVTYFSGLTLVLKSKFNYFLKVPMSWLKTVSMLPSKKISLIVGMFSCSTLWMSIFVSLSLSTALKMLLISGFLLLFRKL